MLDVLLIYILMTIGAFIAGFVINALLLKQEGSLSPGRTNTKSNVPKPSVSPPIKKPLLTTVCHKCNRTYQFHKNPSGKTKVECPYCHAKGIIG